MNFDTLPQTIIGRIKQRPTRSLLLGAAVVALVLIVFIRSGPPPQAGSYHVVKQGDFLVSVVDGGTLQAVNEVVIRNEVEGTSRIIFIVPEGSIVKKSQLLVELDSSAARDAVNLQEINVEKAQFALIQAQQQLDIQKSIVDSEVQAARLKAEFANTDLDKYVKGEAEQSRRNAQIQITNVLDSLQIAQERLQWSEQLYKQGFETKGNLDNDRLKVSQTRLTLEQGHTNLWMIETFDIPKKKRELEATLQESETNLNRVILQGERRLAQYKADVETQQKTLELNQTKLARDKKQLAATQICAPQDGLVVYGSPEGGGHFSSESMIEEGATVRNRQELIKLPDVSEMKLKLKIHESHITQVHVGQPAFVVLDPLPDQRFQGVVSKVAPLPDTQARWGNPDLKVYATEVLITEKLPDVKPGVSGKAEIVVTNLANALSVPIQSVTTRRGKPAVYLAGSPPQPVLVVVGQYNTKFIEVTSGLKAGDRVLLSPPFDTKEKDLAGAVLTEGETMTTNGSNWLTRPQVPLRPQRNGFGTDPMGNRSPASQAENGNGEGDHSRLDRPSNRQDEGAPADLGTPEDGQQGNDRAPGSRSGRRGGGNRPDMKALLRQFDANGDGQLDEAERTAMRETLGRSRRSQGSTNDFAAPEGLRSDGNR